MSELDGRAGGASGADSGVDEALPPWDELRDAAKRDPRTASALRRLGEWLLMVAQEASAEQPSGYAGEAPAACSTEQAVVAAPTVATMLLLGGATAPLVVSGTEEEGRSATIAADDQGRNWVGGGDYGRASRPPDLHQVIRRARLKAECCRWAMDRRRRIAEDADHGTSIAPKDKELLEQARTLSDCRVWMLDPYFTLPEEDEIVELIANCYDAVAGACTVAVEVDGESGTEEEREESYRLAAQAQSALRSALDGVGALPDQDQIDVFDWLRARTFENRVFLDRHMRLNDPADPNGWPELQERIEGFRDQLDARRRATELRRSSLNRVRYHCRKLGSDDGETAAHWQTIGKAVTEFVGAGHRASDPELRDALLPVVDSLPEDGELPAALSEVLSHLDRYLAQKEASREACSDRSEVSAEVERVAAMLQGRELLMIGGQRRVAAQRALERDFRLGSLNWITTSPHDSVSKFEPAVARQETALVILAIRWSSHSFENVRSMCDRYGKPFVRLPAGYGSNRVAHEILRQVSGQIGPPDAR